MHSEQWRALMQEVVVSCGVAPAKQPVEESSNGMTVGELIETLREDYFATRSEKTRRKYTYCLNKHVSQWFTTPVDKITAEKLERWHREGKKGDAWKCLKGFFTLAETRGLIKRVPQPNLRKKKRARKDTRKKAFENRAVQKLKTWLGQRVKNNDSWHPSAIFALIFILGTGERSEAARELRPCEVQWEAGTITKERKGEVTLAIPVSPHVLRFLRQIRPKNDNDYFFPHRFLPDTPISESSLRLFFQKVCAELHLKLPNGQTPNIHTLRHTFATLLKRQGVPETEIQILMGHADVATTFRYFSGSSSQARKHVSSLSSVHVDFEGASRVVA